MQLPRRCPMAKATNGFGTFPAALSSFEAELAGVEGLVQGLAHLFQYPSLNQTVQGWYDLLLKTSPPSFSFPRRHLS